MDSLKVVFLFLFIKFFVCVSTKDVQLVKPCKVADRKCVNEATQLFLQSTSSGIPQIGIKPIDPVLLSAITVQGGKDLTLHYSNVTIRGLKGMKLAYYNVNATAKYVFLLTKQDLTVKSDLMIEQKDKSEKARGTFTAEGFTFCTIKYSFNITKDSKGVKHFDVGPETIHCYAAKDSLFKVSLSEELQRALGRKKCISAVKKMTEQAFSIFVYNIRTAARLLPKTAFFTNI